MRLRHYGSVDYRTGAQMRTGGIHPSAELLFLASGQYRMRWLGEDYEIGREALFLITSNTPHDLTILSPNARFWYVELLDAEQEPFFPGLPDILLWNRLQCDGGAESRLPEAMRHCLAAFERELREEFLSQPYGEELLLLEVGKIWLFVRQQLTLYRKEKEESPRRLSREIVKALALHMETNYKRPISLDSLTRMANYRASALTRHFKVETGMTPIRYLLQLRMKAALAYLETSDMPIGEVAAECGFGGIHHFSGEFKRRFGLSPLDWRREKAMKRD